MLDVVVRQGPVRLWLCPLWVVQRIQVSLVMDITRKPVFSSFLEALEMYSFQSPGSGLT